MQQLKAYNTANSILNLLKKYSHLEYGERCSITSHSVQAGLIAKEKNYDDELVLAAFLHDIGHFSPLELNQNQFETMGDFGIEQHDQWGETYLNDLGFSKRVIAPVKNHVASKRYLCFIHQDYYNELSEASKETLAYQGGVMTQDEAKQFETQPFFHESILIRKIDEEAKENDFKITEQHYNFFKHLIINHLNKQQQ